MQPRAADDSILGILFADTAIGLASVEDRIRSTFLTEAPVIAEIAGYLHAQGGKRVRPLLALTAGRLFDLDPPSPALVDAAAGIELIHMATLLHDDIIDESPTRRHEPSAYQRFGLPPSLLAGDFLLVRAFGLCARLDDFIISRTERACIELTEGEVLEGKLSATVPKSVPDYVDIVAKKTAALFSLAAAVGAHTAGADEREVECLTQFGRNAGIAFQMVDDILDVVADETLLGKPSGTDLRQQTPSLINILWLESGDPEAQEIFSSKTVSSETTRRALETLRTSPVVPQAREIARSYAERASTSLKAVVRKSSRVEGQLLALVDYTLERCS